VVNFHFATWDYLVIRLVTNTSLGNEDNLQSRHVLWIIGKSPASRHMFANCWTECHDRGHAKLTNRNVVKKSYLGNEISLIYIKHKWIVSIYHAQRESVESCHNINNWFKTLFIIQSTVLTFCLLLRGLTFSTFYKNTHFQVNKFTAKLRSFAKLLVGTILNTNRKVHGLHAYIEPISKSQANFISWCQFQSS